MEPALGLSEQLGKRHRAFLRRRQRRQAIQGWSIRKAIDLSACSRVKPAAGSKLPGRSVFRQLAGMIEMGH